MGYNFSGLTFGPKGMIIQESLGILPVNAFLTHPTGLLLIMFSECGHCDSVRQNRRLGQYFLQCSHSGETMPVTMHRAIDSSAVLSSQFGISPLSFIAFLLPISNAIIHALYHIFMSKSYAHVS